MSDDIIVIRFLQPHEIDAPLTAILPSRVHRLLEQAIEAEIETFLSTLKEIKRVDDRDRTVRHGHGSALNLPRGHRDYQGHGKPYRLLLSSPQFQYISV